MTAPAAIRRLQRCARSRVHVPRRCPIHEIECLIPLQPAQPVPASAHRRRTARAHRQARCAGSAAAARASGWQRLTADTPGRFGEIVACLLLADRNGAASRAQIDTFVRVVGDIAPTLPAAFAPPDIAQEVARAESLDRLCADARRADRPDRAETGAGARSPARGCAGVAEAAGFRLAPRRPLRARARGDRRRAVHAAEPAARSLHRRDRCG